MNNSTLFNAQAEIISRVLWVTLFGELSFCKIEGNIFSHKMYKGLGTEKMTGLETISTWRKK
jgi:hypothetical protein